MQRQEPLKIGKRLDIFGISLLPVTAVAVGFLRDLLSSFSSALADPESIYVSTCSGYHVCTFVTSKQANVSHDKKFYKWLREAYLIFDSIKLSFS